MAEPNISLLSATSTASSSVDLSLDPTTTVDGVNNIAKLISEYGPVVVICSVFIILFILIFLLFMKINNTMIKNMIEQMNKKNNENAEITKKLLDHILEEYDEESNDNKKEKTEQHHSHGKDLVGTFIDYTTTFREVSKSVFNNLRCSRVAVYLFHNGNKTLYGFPFIKMSCVFENTMKGTMTIRSTTHTNLPLHLFHDFVDALYNNGEFAGNVDDVEIHDNSMREFLAYSDSKSVFMRAIKKDDGSLAGFTVCEFIKPVDYADQETYNKIKYSIRDMNNVIKYIVTDENFSKKYEHHD